MTVVTFKWGARYPSADVNRLHLTVRNQGFTDWEFVCFTDDPTGLDEGISARPLPEIELPDEFARTFWRKLSMFDPSNGLVGPCLYLDIDTVITGDLNPLFEDWNGEPRFIKNWVGEKTAARDHFDRINSSAFIFTAGTCGEVLEKFYANKDEILRKYPGDQGFVHDSLAERASFFNPEYCVSFKKHCIPKFPLNYFLTPKIPPHAIIVCFHGNPDPHEASKGFRGKKMKTSCRPTPWVFSPPTNAR